MHSYVGRPLKTIRKIQLVQNAAAHGCWDPMVRLGWTASSVTTLAAHSFPGRIQSADRDCLKPSTAWVQRI